MMSRCYNIDHKQYEDYGGRGIEVVLRWHTYENFLEDMGRRPSDKHSIDRKNNDGDYEKKNCRWATSRQQNRNRRGNKMITYSGKTLPLVRWLEKTGVNRSTFYHRLAAGMSDLEALGLH